MSLSTLIYYETALYVLQGFEVLDENSVFEHSYTLDGHRSQIYFFLTSSMVSSINER
jgi:hypothetical protein